MRPRRAGVPATNGASDERPRARRRRDGHQRGQSRATSAGRQLGRLGPVPAPSMVSRSGSRRLTADLLDAGSVVAARAWHRPDARLLHDLAASPYRGREHRRQRAHAAEPARRDGRREVRPPRHARHGAEALPRSVRGLRQGPAGHPVLRGSAPPAVRELLLRRRRTSCSPPPSATGSRGPCTGRTR